MMQVWRFAPVLVLAFGPLVATAQEAALVKCRAIGDSAARLSCYDAISPEQSFGQAAVDEKAAPDTISSSIVGAFDGWEGKQQITLANGQVWQVVDGSRAFYPSRNSPKVRVRKGVLGAFFLDIDGVNQSPRVRRVK